ncbi:MAG: superoxide dismutase family protein [Alphaproteobacteria bacterium]|nr:superoxide dismutase family protein [Alphaproteobacteria bacterium]
MQAATAFLLAALLMSSPVAKAQSAYAEIAGLDGNDRGRVDLIQTARGVLLRLQVNGLPPGPHGFNIHEVGRCEPPFQSAGNHFDVDGNKHGLLSAAGGHAGDLPNLVVPESGALAVELFVFGVSLKEGDANSLLDAEGSALVIHAGPDDHRSDPAGNSGGRIACGVIRQ